MNLIQISLSAAVEDGVYSSITPTANSCAQLRRVLEFADFIDPVGDEKMHVTILYSFNENKATDYPDTQTSYPGRVSEFTFWMGHNGKPYLVALLDSPEIVEANKEWLDLGYTMTFPTYRPHITIKKDFVHPRPLEVITLLNNMLKVHPVRMLFGPQVVEELDV